MQTIKYYLFSSLILILVAVLPHGLLGAPDYLVLFNNTFQNNGDWGTELSQILESQGHEVYFEVIQEGMNAQSIRSFIEAQKSQYNTLKYILLVGRGKDNPYNIPWEDGGFPTSNYITDSDYGNYIPFYYYEDAYYYKDQSRDIPSDLQYVKDLDLYIGRIPAQNVTQIEHWLVQLERYYQQLRIYDSQKNRWQFFVQDNDNRWNWCEGALADEEVNKSIDNFITGTPYTTTTYYAKDIYPVDNASYSPLMDSSFVSGIHDGAGITYISGTAGDQENLGGFIMYPESDLSAFSNSSPNFIFGNTCSLGNTSDPTRVSVLKEMLFNSETGLAGYLAPTVVTTQYTTRVAYYNTLNYLANSGIRELGEIAAKFDSTYYQTDLVPYIPVIDREFKTDWNDFHAKSMVLYGDPSMPLALYQYKEGDITEDETWKGSILVEHNVTIAPGATLSIKPGTGIFFNHGAELLVEGSIHAEGTAGAPIVCAAATDNPGPGYWRGIRIYQNAASADYKLQYVNIQDAEIGFGVDRSVSYTGKLDHVTIEHSHTGMYLDGVNENTSITNCTVKNNDQFGIWMVSSLLTIDHSLIQNNNYGGIYAYRKSAPTLKYNTIIDNGYLPNGTCDGITAVDGSDVKAYGIIDSLAHVCGTNNRIEHNARAGVYATGESYPLLGKYVEEAPTKFGGYNRFVNNDINIWNANTSGVIPAMVNYWSGDTLHCARKDAEHLKGAVEWKPPAPLDGFGKLAMDNTSTPHPELTAARLTEMAGNDSIAATQYENIVNTNPDSAWVGIAVRGATRTWRALGIPNNQINVRLTQWITQFPTSQAAMEAADSKIALLTVHHQYASALNLLDSLAEVWTEPSHQAVFAYEQARITEATEQENGLEKKVSQQVLALYQSVVDTYPGSAVALMAAAKLGSSPPEAPESPTLPKQFTVSAAYPNPFNPATTINYQLPKKSMVTIQIYDLLGRKIWSEQVAHQPRGTFQYRWNGRNRVNKQVSSGVYFIKINAQPIGRESKSITWQKTRKVILLR